MLQFHYEPVSTWPPLAWIASWATGADTVDVRHGNRVETESSWFGEIVWGGPYDESAFDQTDIVYGSACKRTDDGLAFVGSASTLDRLHSIEINGRWFVSNSLACLLSETDSHIDPHYTNYYRDFSTIILGIDHYHNQLKTSNGSVQLTYYRNLNWDGQTLSEIDKPFIQRSRTSIAEYHRFLEQKIQACGDNLRAAARKHSLEFLGTASTGFDSPTVAAIGRAAGLKEVISITGSRSGQDDSGAKIAKQLGLTAIEISRDEWSKKPLAEIPFLASDAKGEDVYFAGAEPVLLGKVLLTGYCGSVWGGRSGNYHQLKRTDQSGLSLTEYRLWAGFINLPLALMGVYQADDIIQLMESSEFESLKSGNSYDKPFCRYVLRDAGVPDDWYGVQKKAASVLIEDRGSFMSAESLADFEAHWKHANRGRPIQLLMGTSHRVGSHAIRRCVGFAQAAAKVAARLTGVQSFKRIGQSVRLSEYAAGDPRFRFLFAWAIKHAKARYRSSQRGA